MKKNETLIDMLQRNAAETPDRIIMRFMDYVDGKWTQETHTLKNLETKALEMAYMLKKKGLKPGDRAVIFSMQDFGTVYAVYGCMMAGVPFTILPPPLDEGKVERFISVLKSSKPKALISNFALEQESEVKLTGRLLKEAFRETIQLKRIYTDKLIPYWGREVIADVSMDDLAYLQYTSGSTNAPKGVMVTWRALMKNLKQCMAVYDFNNGQLATWVPFFHNLGLVITVCMPAVTSNACGYYLQTLKFLENPKLWIKMISDFKLNLTLAPGSAYDACTRIFTQEEADTYDITQVTHFMNGSEFISATSVKRFLDLFHCDRDSMAPGYGLSENVCLASVASRDYRDLKLDYEAYQNQKVVLTDAETDYKEIVSVGPPVKDLTVVVGNPKTGKVYPDLKIGEIFVSGDSLASGYWGGIKDNANFHARMDGYDCDFYKTGDLGFLHEGHIYITGRIKEMLIVNGHNIYPTDLTALLSQRIPALAASSFGFFSCTGETKEQVIAMIESRPDIRFDKLTKQINHLVNEHFDFSFHDVVFVPMNAIPRTDNRKLQMLKARSMYQNKEIPILYSSRTSYSTGEQPDFLAKSVHHADQLIDKADDVLVQVESVFKKVLNREHVSLTESFLELGGDSLMGFELVTKMEERFHIKMDLRELLQDSSIKGISNYIHRVLAGKVSKRKELEPQKECVLDSEIRITKEYTKEVSQCNSIFLTGTTGFLGAQLIRNIVKYYPNEGLRIFCLVRAESEEKGKERIIRNLKHYECYEDFYDAYIIPVIGDLAQPHLGIADDVWNRLAEEVEVIYHNGAILNFVYPYEFLKGTNVYGTAETIRLACEGNPKYYHYVSSYSVYDTPNNIGQRVLEDDPLKKYKGFSLAYSETKWVSEHLVQIARRRGLKAAVYRPGDITGAENGIWDMNDMVSRLMVSMVQMKGMPLAPYNFHMTPVNYVAKAMICISRKPECIGHAFNLVNPKPISLLKLIRYTRKCGYPVRYIPFGAWKNKIRNSDASENAMVLLECLFETGKDDKTPNILRHITTQDTVYDCGNANLLLNGTGISCPPIDETFIAAYLKHFKESGCF